MPSSVFGKDFSQIEFADIQKLKDDGRAENQTLEYKEKMPTRIDLQKEVLGFANGIGGYLIIGIREKRPEGIPDAIAGIDKEGNTKENIVNIVRDNSSPPFIPNVRLVDIPTDTTKCVVIVYSHESDTIHKASDGRYYCRTENETVPLRPELVAKITGKENIRLKVNRILEELDWRKIPERLGTSIGESCWLGIVCCPIPPESFRMPVFSDTEWYFQKGTEALARAGSYDRRSTADSLRVLKVRADGSANGAVEYFENGIIVGFRILYGYQKSIVETELKANLEKSLAHIVEAYCKSSFDGGLIIVFGLGNIAGWKWTTGVLMRDMVYEIRASSKEYLAITQETTVSALESDIAGIVESVLLKFKRNFNIY